MYDRIPSPGKENRVSITQDDGQVITGVLAYADDATQEGSAYTKGNVLPDDVCTAYGIDTETSEPKDAFLAIPGIMGKCFLLITVKKINGAPYPGVLVNGLTGIDTPRRTTNQNGQVAVYVDAGTYSLTFTPNPVCVDTTIPGKSVTLTAGGTGSITTQEQSNGLTSLDITSSRTVAFSANVRNLDVFCVGGGGAGGGNPGNPSGNGAPGGGGGGGRTKTKKNFSFSPYTRLQATVAAGGVGSTNAFGAPGGGSSFAGSVSASGGDGGIGGKSGSSPAGGSGGSGGGGATGGGGAGNGGSDGADGGAGMSSGIPSHEVVSGGSGQGTTTRAFGDAGGDLFSGGGGGGTSASSGTPGSGGSGGGGAGGRSSKGSDGTKNTGGGGGGAGSFRGDSFSGGNGGSGIIKLRWVNAS